MEKLHSFIKNLYNSDNEAMLYIYIAIAVVTVILILLITISGIITKIKNNKLRKSSEPAEVSLSIDDVPSITNETPKEKDLEMPIKIEEVKDVSSIKEIVSIPEEPVINYDKPLEENPEIDLTRHIPRLSTASDLLNEFLYSDDEIPNITPDELNKPLLDIEKKDEPIFSSVFLDKKESEVSKPIINITLTPIVPDKIDDTKEKAITPISKDLMLEPNVLKKEEPKAEVKEPIKEEPKAEVKEPIKEEPKADVKELIKEEPKADVKEPIKEEPKIEVKESIKEEPKAEVKESIKEEPKTEVKEPIKEEPKVEVKEPIKEEPKAEVKEPIKEKRDDSLDTKVDIFSHESLSSKDIFANAFKPKTQEELIAPKEKINSSKPVVLSADDLKSKLNNLKSKVKEQDDELKEILRDIGLDDLSDISPEVNNNQQAIMKR